ncbi:hypothetical protein [Mycobacteroides chelonae]|uniref:hypothetical protein n=1 Tax=Mycobacteroides chelonae TaxID=1774 RepID=UPI00104208C2|nr:hypothetical protein [Mycobacteroides chelonae]
MIRPVYASLRDPVTDLQIREFECEAQAAEMVKRSDEHDRGPAARYSEDLSAINEFAENVGIVSIPDIPPAVALGRYVRRHATGIWFGIIGVLAAVLATLVLTGARAFTPAMILPMAGAVMSASGWLYLKKDLVSDSSAEQMVTARKALLDTFALPVKPCAASAAAASEDEPDSGIAVPGRVSERDRKIEAIRCAVTQLDREWLDFQLKLYDWWLGKPALRDDTVPATAAYRDAYDQLTQLADELSDSSSDEQIAAADQAAERALLAWQAANAHAEVAGVSDRTPTERAALRHLNTLVAELADPGTVRERWPVLVAHIGREMDKLTTIPASWAQVRAYLNSLGIGERLPAIEA